MNVISNLTLARYGLANYIIDSSSESLTQNEETILENLSRGGQRLMGFCRTNLFKRLESSGQAFIQSVDRHILRNYVFLHAIGIINNYPSVRRMHRCLIRLYDEDLDNINVMEDPLMMMRAPKLMGIQ